MNDEAAFLKAIKKKPKERTIRLVFADWLEERGDPRAAWVRDDRIWEWMKPDAKNPTDKLIATVRGRDSPRQRHAVRVLQSLGAAAVPGLLAALRDALQDGDRSWSPLQDALCEICRAAEPALLPLLLAAAKDPNERVQHGVNVCFAELMQQSETALETIVAEFGNRYREVPTAVLWAFWPLTKTDTGQERLRCALPLLNATLGAAEGEVPHDSRYAAACLLDKLRAVNESAIPALIRLLWECTTSGHGVVDALAPMGLSAVSALLDAAREPQRPTEWPLRVIERIGLEAVPLLRQALESTHPNVRHFAATALAKLTPELDAAVLAGLSAAIASRDPIRHSAAQVTIQRGPAAATTLPALLSAIERAEPNEYLGSAALAIAELGPVAHTAVPTLLDFVGRLNDAGCWGAGRALDHLGYGPSALLAFLNRDESETHRPMPLAMDCDDFAEDIRTELMHAYFDNARRARLVKVARLAFRSPPADAVRAVRRFLSPRAQATRLVALFALRHLGTEDAATELLGVLKDKDRLIRETAVRALGHIGAITPEVLPALQRASKDRARNVRSAATKALGQLTDH
jgi:uncharacterized protein (TIGR02996 family)